MATRPPPGELAGVDAQEEFEQEMWHGKAAALFVGNQEQHPASFLVLGVFWPPNTAPAAAPGPISSNGPPTLPRDPGLGDDLRVTGRIYSVGYEGMTLDALVDRLAGVSVLVDVRLNPVSRKPGFSKKRLTAALEEAGIEYVHEKELGNPQDEPRLVPQRRRRGRQIEDASDAEQRRRRCPRPLGRRASNQRVAVLCVERDHSRCSAT